MERSTQALARLEAQLEHRASALRVLNRRLDENIHTLRRFLKERSALERQQQPPTPTAAAQIQPEGLSSVAADQGEGKKAASKEESMEEKLSRILSLAKETRVSKSAKAVEPEKAFAKETKRVGRGGIAVPNRSKPESLRTAFLNSAGKLPSAPSAQPTTSNAPTIPPKSSEYKAGPSNSELRRPQAPHGTADRQLAALNSRRTLLQQLGQVVFNVCASRPASAICEIPFPSILARGIIPDYLERVSRWGPSIDPEVLQQELARAFRTLHEVSETTGYRRTEQEYYQLVAVWFRALVVQTLAKATPHWRRRGVVGERRLVMQTLLPVRLITTLRKLKDTQEPLEFQKLNAKWRRLARSELQQGMQSLKNDILSICQEVVGSAALPYAMSLLRRCAAARCDGEQWRPALCLLRSVVNVLLHDGTDPQCMCFLSK